MSTTGDGKPEVNRDRLKKFIPESFLPKEELAELELEVEAEMERVKKSKKKEKVGSNTKTALGALQVGVGEAARVTAAAFKNPANRAALVAAIVALTLKEDEPEEPKKQKKKPKKKAPVVAKKPKTKKKPKKKPAPVETVTTPEGITYALEPGEHLYNPEKEKQHSHEFLEYAKKHLRGYFQTPDTRDHMLKKYAKYTKYPMVWAMLPVGPEGKLVKIILRLPALRAFKEAVALAKANGKRILVSINKKTDRAHAYRDDEWQYFTYKRNKAKNPNAVVAKAGHSRHAPGLALDIRNWADVQDELNEAGFLGGAVGGKYKGIPNDSVHFEIRTTEKMQTLASRYGVSPIETPTSSVA